ncbi:MAG TPA: Flp pilus assembly protein CpaB [Bryobacteraceae bacterium]|jgi:pilus assembly protein CpaB|nr:Flp pilus assembly protein CpaB [Bryobacteraceae bacterium]
MKKNNLIKLLGIAFVVAIVSTGVFYGLFVNKLSSNTGSGKMLVVAARTLRPGAVLKTDDVKLVPWFAPDLPKGAFSSADQVAGSTVFDTIGEDEPLLVSHLASGQNGGSGVPSGMRAVSIHVTDSTGVLSLLRAGQKVDVQVVVGRGNSEAALVRTALEDLQVLSITPQPEQSSQGATLPVVTLLADPRQADVLAAADSGARVRLTLRNPLDQERSSDAPLSLGSIMHATGKTIQ